MRAITAAMLRISWCVPARTRWPSQHYLAARREAPSWACLLIHQVISNQGASAAMNENLLFKLFKGLLLLAAVAAFYVALCVVAPELAMGLFALAVITAPWWYGAVRRAGR